MKSPSRSLGPPQCESLSKRVSRRRFLESTAGMGAVALGVLGFPSIGRCSGEVLGQGDFRYRVVPGWGELGPQTPLKNCHGIVCDRQGHLILLTDHTANNVILYDRSGKLVHKWGTEFPGAHGLSLVQEAGREVLYLTDLQTHCVVKTTLDGEKLQEWRWPEATGRYIKESEYRPSWTLHRADGGFYVLDGYGKDYILGYGADGKLAEIFGGAEGGIVHWGPHGGMMQRGSDSVGGETLLIAMSDQQHLLRLDSSGRELERVELLGGNPRQIRKHGEHYFVAHLGDQWPKDRNAPGFVSVLDAQWRVCSNVGGTAPVYTAEGRLERMAHVGNTFIHPHDLVVDAEGSLYVAQFASGQTAPVKLERV